MFCVGLFVIDVSLIMALQDKQWFCCVARDKTGVTQGDLLMSFRSIFQDVRAAVDWVHIKVGTMSLGLNPSP